MRMFAQGQKPLGPLSGKQLLQWRQGSAGGAVPADVPASAAVVHTKLRVALPLWLLAEHYGTPDRQR
jgi:hypothetical protein